MFEAKKHCTEVRRLVQAEHLEVMMARAHAAANGTQEVVDTVESLLQLGLTEFEASMEQFERADRSLARLRQAATARPPELNYQPEVTEAVFNMLRDRYYNNRSKDMAKLLSVVDVDRSQDTFANGGPVANRVKKDALQGLDYELDIVGLPGSPMGFTVLRFSQPSQPLSKSSANVAVHLSQEEADTRVFDFLSEDHTPTATKV